MLKNIETATLQVGLDDWIALGDVVAVAIFYGAPRIPSPDRFVMISESYVIPVIARLVGDGLVRIGDVYTQGRFVRFDGSDEEALAWVAKIYRERQGAWDYAVWMELTRKGKALAESLPTARYHIRESDDDA
ncbi:hypothetical protein [Cellulomonas taurus]|uniref:hypothetical protein n=1 Tax=Cellulomonas taurus TaxID=2729175 RepID=UPI00145E2910|nr:hypothetical protein [Cellulomonas taurus]